MATKLEQFENWCGEIEYLCVDYTKKDSMRRGWKAALEWALSHKKPIKYNDYKFDYIKTDVIEEELNGNK